MLVLSSKVVFITFYWPDLVLVYVDSQNCPRFLCRPSVSALGQIGQMKKRARKCVCVCSQVRP